MKFIGTTKFLGDQLNGNLSIVVTKAEQNTDSSPPRHSQDGKRTVTKYRRKNLSINYFPRNVLIKIWGTSKPLLIKSILT